MINVKICGAGSIGNHLAYACRSRGWDVLICDVDHAALKRTREEIYPSRYGVWDEGIRLELVNKLKQEKFDLVIIGTPPDTHIKVALDILEKDPPRCMLIEKPLATPSLEGCEDLINLVKSLPTQVVVGYNHTLTKNTQIAEKILRSNSFGEPLTITAKFREYWGGIFKAHPWLDGPKDSYLGFSSHGGGASGEHSHAVNIWQHFAHMVDMGRIVEVSAMMDNVDNGYVKYDRICQFNVKTEKGLIGNIIQDVITEPPQKNLRIQCANGSLEWYVNWDKCHDAVQYKIGEQKRQEEFCKKNRTDDFKGEILHIEEMLNGKLNNSPISLEKGLDTMLVIAAAHISHKLKRSVRINYDSGYKLEAIETI